ncbi:chloroperoxidase [Podospora conica]|nr:chloroperoxidase [Schizothecium conicum]
MLNALANHGFFPRSGKNISIEQMVSGIDLALNLDPASSRPVVELAVTTSTTGNPLTVNLDDMATHGVIEHDGSLSRADAITGNANRLNPAIYASYIANFAGKSVITIPDAARARRARIAAAQAINPNFVFTPREDEFSRFETSLYLAVFGTGTIGNAPKKWVDVMFREERIPYKEGYVRPTDVITNDDLVELATKLITA